MQTVIPGDEDVCSALMKKVEMGRMSRSIMEAEFDKALVVETTIRRI